MNPFEKDWTAQPSMAISGAYAELVIVLDRSASMASMSKAVVEGLNNHIQGIRQQGGSNRWTMVQFDDPQSARGADELFPQVVYEGKPEKEIPLLRLASGFCSGAQNSALVSDGIPFLPRGGTALLDALCETIDRTALRTSGQEHVKVVMGIFTDGEENSSIKYKKADLRERVARMQKERGWDFLYFGANQDSFAEAGSVAIGGYVSSGLMPGGTSYTNNFVPTAAGMMAVIGSGMVGMSHIASGSVCSGSVVEWNKMSIPSAVVGLAND